MCGTLARDKIRERQIEVGKAQLKCDLIADDIMAGPPHQPTSHCYRPPPPPRPRPVFFTPSPRFSRLPRGGSFVPLRACESSMVFHASIMYTASR